VFDGHVRQVGEQLGQLGDARLRAVATLESAARRVEKLVGDEAG
jgi:hypothetical protein